MSWAAHEFESYVLHRHTGVRASFLGVLVGCLLPDLFTKMPVYGLDLGPLHVVHAAEPWKYHRGWPGVGPTHSLLFIAVVAVIVLWGMKSREWSLGILVGGWAHVLTDCFDSTGTMLFFPFTTQHYSFGMWSYAAQEGRYGDASAYYSSLGGVWDAFWLGMCLLNRQVFSRKYFLERVAPYDPAWHWMQRRLRCSSDVLFVVYRAYFIYGAARVLGWSLWARLVNPERGRNVLDLTWGGPGWVVAAPDQEQAVTWAGTIGVTLIGAFALLFSLALLWWFPGRRLWNRATVRAPIPLTATQPSAIGIATVTDTGQ